MKKRHAATTAFAMLLIALPAFAEDAAGNWTGAIDGHLVSLVHVERGTDGSLTGTFASHEAPLTRPDFSALKCPIANVAATSDHLAFTVPGNSGIFDGHWDDARKAWVGTFQWGKGGYKSTLVLQRTDMQSLPAAPVPITYAHPEDETRAMDQSVQAWVDDGSFMGSVLVMQNGQILLDKGYGFADIAHAVPNTPRTAYRIGSITKQFTAASILLLQERGKLNINAPVKTYLPDAPAAWDHITLYNLLTHTSGLVRDADPDGTGTGPEHLMAALHDKPLLFAPGDGYSYSNAGYEVLGLIVEKVSGQTYGDFVHDNLFAPAGMTASAFKPKADPHLAVGYDSGAQGPVPVPETTYAGLYTAGGIVSTTHDLALWQSALVSGKVLSPASLKLMATPFKDGYGTGLEITSPYGHLDIGHGGLVHGFATQEHYEPDDRLSIIVLGNLNGETTAVANSLVAIARGLPGTFPPKGVKSVEIPQATLQTYVGTYVMSPQFQIVVTLENGQLMAQGGGYPKMALYAQSDGMFYTRSLSYVRMKFVKGSDGATSVIVQIAGLPDRVGQRQ
jgi:CubicO group peptidase (beta-lactamase class C family)